MNEFKVGLLALGAMASVIYMSFWITANQSGFGNYVPYKTVVKDASGIFPKTPIKVAGINAGRIKSISLEGNEAHIVFEILERIQIPQDSKLRIKTVGFLGDKYLEIVVGKSQSRLSPLSPIPASEGGGMDGLVNDAGDILKDVKVIVKDLRSSLSPENGEGGLKKIIGDLESTMASAKDATKSLKNIFQGNEERINNLIANFEDMSEDLAYEVSGGEPKSAMADVKKILDNAKNLTGDLKDMIANMKAGKGTIGKLMVEDEIADEVKQTISGVRKLIGKVDSIRTELSVYTGANTLYGPETEAGLRIIPSPERFYHLGVVTSEFGVERERHTKTVINGVETNEVQTVRQKNTFRFNVQIGRNFQNWTLRGGLIETTGGFGVDYNFSRWLGKLSLDVFDYREDIGANFRLSAEAQIWNVLYGRISGEDLAEDSRSATFSAGLKFSDEDLKGLIGFFF